MMEPLAFRLVTMLKESVMNKILHCLSSLIDGYA